MKMGPGHKVVVVALLASLGACSDGDREASSEGEDAVAPPMASVATDEVERRSPESMASKGFGETEVGVRQAFAVSHRLGLAVAPDRVRPHFLAVKELCASETRCELLAASASVVRQGGDVSSAFIEVRLPHEAVARFEERAVAPLEGEDRGRSRFVATSRRRRMSRLPRSMSRGARSSSKLIGEGSNVSPIARRVAWRT